MRNYINFLISKKGEEFFQNLNQKPETMQELTIIESKKASLTGEMRTQKNIYDANENHFIAIINNDLNEPLQEHYSRLFLNAPKLLHALEEITNVDFLDEHAVFKAQQLAHRTLSLFKK